MKESKAKRRGSGNGKPWSSESLRKEQIRIAVAVGAEAASYYVIQFQLSQSWVGLFLYAIGAMALVFWGFYLFLIAVAVADDLLVIHLSDVNALRAKKAAHLFYAVGILAIVFVGFLLVAQALFFGGIHPS